MAGNRSGSRRRSREFALQILFQVDVATGEMSEVLERFWSTLEATEEVRAFAERLVDGVVREREAIDARISAVAENWKLGRMAVVDRNVLRIAVRELIVGDTPAPVVIDEAIEIAKRFGDSKSGPFVNGILDRVSRRLELERAEGS